MGTIAARDCLRVLELSEQVIAAMLIAARQAVELRQRNHADVALPDKLAVMHADLSQRIPLVVEDRALDQDLIALLGAIRGEAWNLYAA